MKKQNIKDVFNEMSKRYNILKGSHKYQILSMVMSNGIIVPRIFKNTILSNGYSDVKKHCERVAYESINDSEDLIIFVTVVPCEQCYRNFIKNNPNIRKVYYLCEEFLENKMTYISGDKRLIPISRFFKEDQKWLNRVKNELLSGYIKNTRKRKGKLKKVGEKHVH